MSVFKEGDMIWTLKKSGTYQQRKVKGIFPYHISTYLLEGEPTQDAKTGQFIYSKDYLRLEVGHTKEDLLNNRISFEITRISRAELETAQAEKIIRFCDQKLKEL